MAGPNDSQASGVPGGNGSLPGPQYLPGLGVGAITPDRQPIQPSPSLLQQFLTLIGQSAQAQAQGQTNFPVDALATGAEAFDEFYQQNQAYLDPWFNNISRLYGSAVAGQNPFSFGDQGGIHGPTFSEALTERGVDPLLAAGAEFLVADPTGAKKVSELIPLLGLLPAFRGLRSLGRTAGEAASSEELLKGLERVLEESPDLPTARPELGPDELRVVADELRAMPEGSSVDVRGHQLAAGEVADALDERIAGMQYGADQPHVPLPRPDTDAFFGLDAKELVDRSFGQRAENLMGLGLSGQFVDIGALPDRASAYASLRHLGETPTGNGPVGILNYLAAAAALPNEIGAEARALIPELTSATLSGQRVDLDLLRRVERLERSIDFAATASAARHSADQYAVAVRDALQSPSGTYVGVDGLTPDRLMPGNQRLIDELASVAGDDLIAAGGGAWDDLNAAIRTRQDLQQEMQTWLSDRSAFDATLSAMPEPPVRVTDENITELAHDFSAMSNMYDQDIADIANIDPAGMKAKIKEVLPDVADEDVDKLVTYFADQDIMSQAPSASELMPVEVPAQAAVDQAPSPLLLPSSPTVSYPMHENYNLPLPPTRSTLTSILSSDPPSAHAWLKAMKFSDTDASQLLRSLTEGDEAGAQAALKAAYGSMEELSPEDVDALIRIFNESPVTPLDLENFRPDPRLYPERDIARGPTPIDVILRRIQEEP